MTEWGESAGLSDDQRISGEKMKGVIVEVFTSVLELLEEEGYVELENYFMDGSKVEANANRH